MTNPDDLVDVPMGPEAEFEIGKMVKGILPIKANYNGADGGASVWYNVKAHDLLEKLKVAIPGSFDDVVINIVEGAAGV